MGRPKPRKSTGHLQRVPRKGPCRADPCALPQVPAPRACRRKCDGHRKALPVGFDGVGANGSHAHSPQALRKVREGPTALRPVQRRDPDHPDQELRLFANAPRPRGSVSAADQTADMFAFCGRCNRLVTYDADNRCRDCGRKIWELEARRCDDGYRAPSRCRSRRRCPRLMQAIMNDLATIDTAARRHARKYKEDF